MNDQQPPTYAFYEAFQRAEFDRWDDVIANDVAINSPAGYGMQGLKLLKDWAGNFVRLGYRITSSTSTWPLTSGETAAGS
jgi:hypothetical protein